MPETGGDVRVARAEDGTVRIGADPAGPAFRRAVLDVAGAVLTWPVSGAPGLPAAQVHDVGQAQQWLWALYGARVAEAVHHGAADVTVTAQMSTLAGAAARLAFGHWAARWWPASYLDGISALEQDLLGLELAALTHQCQQLFDADSDSESAGPAEEGAADLIAEHQAALDALVRWWRAAAQPTGTVRHLDRILRLIHDAGDLAGLDGPALRHLRASLEQRPAIGAAADVGALFARERGYALAAGEPLAGGGRVIARGPGTNAWHRYPPGLVDAAENAVSWTGRAFGARRQIEVDVIADAAAPAAGVLLVAEVRVDGGRVAARVPLARRDDRWTGRVDLDLDGDLGAAADPERPAGWDLTAAGKPPRIEVDVLLPGFDPGPGDPGDAAHRATVRALVRQRLATAARPSPYDTVGTTAPHAPHATPAAPFLAEIIATTAEDF
ncbi:hypothetical protein ABZ721_31690 [Streptomyces sp. NPDC006733]|uniref:hypothetical protein n=1 Tax=Streptomyces sp. NPDC006733 TaxID=3155460 RepID=UPI0033DD7BBA